jgi:hypothetical protein
MKEKFVEMRQDEPREAFLSKPKGRIALLGVEVSKKPL